MPKPPTLGSGGRAPQIADVHVVALYDPNTGRILHVHNVTVYRGGREVSEREAIETAIARASAAGHQIEALKIKVSKDISHGRAPHKIDVVSGAFIALAPSERRQDPKPSPR